MGALLQSQDLYRSFGGVTAIDGLSFEIEAESITALIGPNGAGKTTTFDIITGLITPDAGRVIFRGTDITGWEPYRVAREGIGRTFQHAQPFERMTVRENLEVVPYNGDRAGKIEDLLDLVQLSGHADTFADELSGGQQILLGIARTLMLQPTLLLLDEPFAGVNPGLVADLIGVLRELRRDEGVTLCIIDHEIDHISDVCDRAIVLNEGKVLVEGSPAEVRENERVIDTYLGGV